MKRRELRVLMGSGMLSKSQVVENAIAAFTKLHARAEHTVGVRAIDRGELNLKEMNCVEKSDGSWVCTLPHVHLPLVTLSYEFVYTVRGDPPKAEYSCKPVDVTSDPD